MSSSGATRAPGGPPRRSRWSAVLDRVTGNQVVALATVAATVLALLTWVGLTPGGDDGAAPPAPLPATAPVATDPAGAPEPPRPTATLPGTGVSVTWSGEIGSRALVPGATVGALGGPPGSCTDASYGPWLRGRGAVAAKESLGVAELRTDRSTSVTLLGLDVRVHSRRPALAGAYLRCLFGGDGGESPSSWVDVDLDAPGPRISVSDRFGGPARERILVTLRPDTPHLVFVRLRAAAGAYEVSCDLIALVDNRRTVVPLIRRDAPVTVTGVPGATVMHAWDYGKRVWAPFPAD